MDWRTSDFKMEGTGQEVFYTLITGGEFYRYGVRDLLEAAFWVHVVFFFFFVFWGTMSNKRKVMTIVIVLGIQLNLCKLNGSSALTA